MTNGPLGVNEYGVWACLRRSAGASKPGRVVGRANLMVRVRRPLSDAEVTFFNCLLAYRERPNSKLAFIFSHFVMCLRAFGAFFKLEQLTAAPSAEPQGAAIRRALKPRAALLRSGIPVVSVLSLPEDPSQIIPMAPKIFGKKVRRAQRRGIVCLPVDDPADRIRLAKEAAEAERTHPDEQYRNVDADSSELLQFPTWIAAYSADDEPLLLAVAIVDGDVAMLRYFRSLGWGQEHGEARYLGLQALAAELSAQGVRQLFDQTSLTGLQKGLLHYQRMVGFRIVRIRLR
jgi:hypothetical protein